MILNKFVNSFKINNICIKVVFNKFWYEIKFGKFCLNGLNIIKKYKYENEFGIGLF